MLVERSAPGARTPALSSPRWTAAARPGWLPIALVVAAALLARLAVWLVVFHGGPPVHEEPSEVAANLLSGRGYVFEQYGAPYVAWKEPLYMLGLAGVLRLFGPGDIAPLVVQSCIGAGVAVAAYALAREVLISGELGATLAGLLVAVNPFLLYYDTHYIHELSTDTLFFVLTTLLLVRLVARPDPRPGRAGRAGLLSGLALWERSTLLASGLGFWLAALLVLRGRRTGILRQAAVWLAVALLVFAPWLVRNHLVLGRWVVTTDAAHIMWLGNNPLSNGTYSNSAGERVIYLDPAFLAQVTGRSELQQMDTFSNAARAFITSHPLDFLRLCAIRAWSFVWFSPNAGVDYTFPERVAYTANYVFLLILAAVGGIELWRRGSPGTRTTLLLLAGSIAGLAAVYVVSVVNLKHRVPLEVLLAVLAAQALAGGWQALERRRRLRSAARGSSTGSGGPARAPGA